jgi:hypothetical protein
MYSFSASNNGLMAWGVVLRRINANQFYDLGSDVITFENSGGTMKARLDIQGETYFSGRKVEELHSSNAALGTYAGPFQSQELDAMYSVSLVHGMLTLRVGNNPPKKLTQIAPDEFDSNGLGRIVFQRDSQGRVSALAIFTQDARGIELRKLN